MTREGPLPPPSADEIAEGDFIASIEGTSGHRAIVLSDAAGSQFYAFCAPCSWRGHRWMSGGRRYVFSVKRWAQDEADRHNDEGDTA